MAADIGQSLDWVTFSKSILNDWRKSDALFVYKEAFLKVCNMVWNITCFTATTWADTGSAAASMEVRGVIWTRCRVVRPNCGSYDSAGSVAVKGTPLRVWNIICHGGGRRISGWEFVSREWRRWRDGVYDDENGCNSSAKWAFKGCNQTPHSCDGWLLVDKTPRPLVYLS